ncbi:sigma-54 interaction domain-containing protein [Desulfocicer niacini]
MKVDEREFFKNATLKICSSLEIGTALHECLLYICQFIPADITNFHIYHKDTGIMETVAYADCNRGKSISIKVKLGKTARMRVEKQRSLRIRIIDRLGDDLVTAPLAHAAGVADKSSVLLDLVLDRTMVGTFSVAGEKQFTKEHVHLLSLLVKPCAIALANSLRYREIKNLKELLTDDNQYLREELNKISGKKVIGAEEGLKDVMERVYQVSPLDSPVLLTGETGTGKEVIANAIHHLSPRRKGPLIRVNCGAIPSTLLDSELFGHEKGSFTGARSRKRGRIERAQGGTLFLDEIGELTAEAQVRLLRVLQEKEIDRVGGDETIKVNIRIIAATHRDLKKMLDEKKFRADLFFRLRIFPIDIPPLRKRKKDIPDLVRHFILKKCEEMKRGVVPSPTQNAMSRLLNYDWPGNIRELENAVERSLILDQGSNLFFKEIGAFDKTSYQADALTNYNNLKSPIPLDEAMAEYIQKVLALCNGRVSGEKGAAKLLDINPSTLRKRMKKLGILSSRKMKTC